jgi:mannosyl-3-phosphoglycerate phosphatase
METGAAILYDTRAMLVVFTDLDGTLLDSDSYSAEAARPSLGKLRSLGIPLIFCSSKTRAEIEWWRGHLENDAPFIAENGGALFIPDGYFQRTIISPVRRNVYAVVEFGAPYARLVETLKAAASKAGCRIRGFHDMSASEVAARCEIPLWMAELAKRREYDEPFEILDGDPEALARAIAARKMRSTRGGRFYHLTGANDKAHAVRLLAHYFEPHGNQFTTMGVGDALNDAGFLKAVDVPIILPSSQLDALRRAVPHARIAGETGPAGWNSAMLELLETACPAASRDKGMSQSAV